MIENNRLHIIFFLIAAFHVLCLSASEPRFEIVTSNSNTLYLGIDNLIEIPDYDPDELVLKGNNGQVFRDSIYFNIIPRKLPQVDVVLYQLQNQDTLELKKARLRVEHVPEACIRIADTCLSEFAWISKTYFKKYSGLDFYVSDDIIGSDNWGKIVRISIGYSVLGGMYKTMNAKGGKFTEEMIRKISKLPYGTLLSIKVSVQNESAVIKRLPIYKAKLK